MSTRSPAGSFPVVYENEAPAVLQDETRVLVSALAADGPADRHELSRRVRAHYWGPGRFRLAVRHGVQSHQIAEDHGRLRAVSGGARSRSRH